MLLTLFYIVLIYFCTLHLLDFFPILHNNLRDIEYALSFYGLIPERVTTITCATFDKKKKKQYNTSFGTFTYRDVPSSAYPEEIILKEENDYSFQIATVEKALCDKNSSTGRTSSTSVSI